jgi:hypothetical protein
VLAVLLQLFAEPLEQVEATQYLVPLLLLVAVVALVFITLAALQMRTVVVLVVAVREYCRPLEQAQEDRVTLRLFHRRREVMAAQEILPVEQAPHLVAVAEQVRLAHLHQT